MAYVHPREASHDVFATVVRNGARFLAVAAYTTAVVVAIVLLAPVLFDGGSATAQVPPGPETISYKAAAGETAQAIAAAHGLSASGLYALNPALTPLSNPRGERIVVGLR
jgi:hypothetical protein